MSLLLCWTNSRSAALGGGGEGEEDLLVVLLLDPTERDGAQRGWLGMVTLQQHTNFVFPLPASHLPITKLKSLAHKFTSSPSLQCDGLSLAHSGHLGGSQATRVWHRSPRDCCRVLLLHLAPLEKVLCTGTHGGQCALVKQPVLLKHSDAISLIKQS